MSYGATSSPIPAGQPWTIAGPVILAAAAAILVLITIMHPQKDKLNGLLVDLEFAGPDPGRYRELREALTIKLPLEVPSLADTVVALEYCHFTQVASLPAAVRNADFVLLSPQGTPWNRYTGEAGAQLDLLKQQLHEIALHGTVPLLGICGGHQFLALAFGGEVGFIDPAYAASQPERYPGEALGEKGAVILETIGDDPIFRGVAGHPGTFSVMQSHYEEVKTVPPPLVNLARSGLCEAQLMRLPGRLVYGMAFHPERGWQSQEAPEGDKQAGKQLLANFVTMVLSEKRARLNYGRRSEKPNTAATLD